MAKYEVGKSVEATKLNKRTGIPLVGHAVTIPYGAILDDVEEDGDYYKFSYLSEPYQMKKEVVKGAFHKMKGHGEATDHEQHSGSHEDKHAEKHAEKPALVFEHIRVRGAGKLSRAKIPGGWLVSGDDSVTFVPDAEHEWDGTSL